MPATSNKGQQAPVKGIPERLRELGKCGLGTMMHPETARWIARVILFAHMEKAMSDGPAEFTRKLIAALPSAM